MASTEAWSTVVVRIPGARKSTLTFDGRPMIQVICFSSFDRMRDPNGKMQRSIGPPMRQHMTSMARLSIVEDYLEKEVWWECELRGVFGWKSWLSLDLRTARRAVIAARLLRKCDVGGGLMILDMIKQLKFILGLKKGLQLALISGLGGFKAKGYSYLPDRNSVA